MEEQGGRHSVKEVTMSIVRDEAGCGRLLSTSLTSDALSGVKNILADAILAAVRSN